MKGKIMTEVTTETTEQVLTPEQQAAENRKKAATEFVNSRPVADIIDHLAYQYEQIAAARDARIRTAGRLESLISTVTDFIKDNLETGASEDDLKQLASDLEIELTKTLKVEMRITYYAEITVPLDFDEESIDEDDFSISISYEGSDSDVSLEEESTEVDDFNVEEA